MQQFPQVAIGRYLLQMLKAYQQEFGLTLSARTRIEVVAPPRKDGELSRVQRSADGSQSAQKPEAG